MDDMTAVRRAVDRLLGGDLGPMLDLLAEGVEFEVEEGGDSPARRMDWGKQAVAAHFAALGELVAFWQIDYGAVDGQVIAWGKESFTVEGCGLEGECEFAFVFDLDGGRITRFLVIEDLTRAGKDILTIGSRRLPRSMPMLRHAERGRRHGDIREDGSHRGLAVAPLLRRRTGDAALPPVHAVRGHP
jgi:ketosteroid isomerase-like protein